MSQSRVARSKRHPLKLRLRTGALVEQRFVTHDDSRGMYAPGAGIEILDGPLESCVTLPA